MFIVTLFYSKQELGWGGGWGGMLVTWCVGDTVVLVSIQVLHGGQTHTLGETLIRLRSEPPSSCLFSSVTHARVTVSWIELFTFQMKNFLTFMYM